MNEVKQINGFPVKDATSRAQIEATNASIEATNLRIDDTNAEVESVKNSVEQTNGSVADVIADLTAMQTSIENTNARINTTNANVEQNKAEILSAKTSIQTTNIRIDSVNTNMETLQTEMGNLQEQMENNDATVMATKVLELENEVDALNKAIAENGEMVLLATVTSTSTSNNVTLSEPIANFKKLWFQGCNINASNTEWCYSDVTLTTEQFQSGISAIPQYYGVSAETSYSFRATYVDDNTVNSYVSSMETGSGKGYIWGIK